MFSVKLVALFFIVSVAVSWIPGNVNIGVTEAAPSINFFKKNVDLSTTVVNNGTIGKLQIGRSFGDATKDSEGKASVSTENKNILDDDDTGYTGFSIKTLINREIAKSMQSMFEELEDLVKMKM
ncbi:uncharacterized protein LOC142981925 [Anticarsia gemmatalis]|uniref:uncharacterized protein LOC142981925 n=1 Tax=Anticarsia gemmatalis TaxID=129554 RepID=UPI003F75DCF3